MSEYDVKATLSADGRNLFKTMDAAADRVESFAATGQKSTAAFSAAFSLMQRTVNAALSGIMSGMQGAIKRFDTLNRYPKIMEQLGYETAAVNKSLQQMSAGIEGLPTTMDEIVSSAQGIALINGDLEKATEIAIAFNDAMYASGASASDASRGLLQFTQMMSAGRVDMMSWRTLLETMPLALNQVAEAFGYAGASAKNDLYEALKTGEVTFDEFAQKIVELDAGVNGFASMARTASEGLATSMQNIRSAVVKGLAGTLQAIDDGLAAGGLPKMSKALDNFKVVINNAFTSINGVIRKMVSAVAPVIKFLGDNIATVKVVVEGLITALLGLKIGQKVKGWMDKLAKSHADAAKKIQLLKDNSDKYNGTMSITAAKAKTLKDAEDKLIEALKRKKAAEEQLRSVQQNSAGDTEALQAATVEYNAAVKDVTDAQTDYTNAQQLNNTQLSLGQLLHAVLTKQLSLTEAAQLGLNQAMKANPIGLVITAVTALVTAFRALDTIMEKLSPGYKEFKEFGEQQKAVWNGVSESNKALSEFKTNMEASELATEKSNEEINTLITQIFTMAEGESDSAAVREALTKKTDKLNQLLGESVLIYNEETNSLNMDRKAMEKYAKQREQQQKLAWIDEQLAAAKEEYTKAMEDSAKATIVSEKAVQRAEKQYGAFLDTQGRLNPEMLKDSGNLEQFNAVIQSYGMTVGWAQQKTEEAEKSYASNAEEYESITAELYAQRETLLSEIATSEEEAVQAYVASLKEMLDSGTATYDMLSEANQALVGDLRSTYQDYVAAATDMFNRLETESDTSLQTLAENLEHNKTVVGQWAQNLADLRSFFADNDVVQPLLDHFASMGPEAAPYIQQMIDAVRNGDQQLILNMAEDFNSVQPAAVTWLEQATGSDLPAAVEKMVSTTESSLSEAVRNVDWSAAGADVVTGFADEGIMGNLDKGETAGTALADTTYDAAEIADRRGSPSRKYRDAGRDNVQGFVNGYKAMQGTAVSTAQSLAVQVMLGFEKGLNQVANRVYNTAERIAQTVAATIAKALDINSPSGVAEDLGWFFGKGLANGMLDAEAIVAQASGALAAAASGISVPNVGSYRAISSPRGLAFAGNAAIDAASIGAMTQAPAEVYTTINIDGRAVAKAITPAVTEEQTSAAQFSDMRRGIR